MSLKLSYPRLNTSDRVTLDNALAERARNNDLIGFKDLLKPYPTYINQSRACDKTRRGLREVAEREYKEAKIRESKTGRQLRRDELELELFNAVTRMLSQGQLAVTAGPPLPLHNSPFQLGSQYQPQPQLSPNPQPHASTSTAVSASASASSASGVGSTVVGLTNQGFVPPPATAPDSKLQTILRSITTPPTTFPPSPPPDWNRDYSKLLRDERKLEHLNAIATLPTIAESILRHVAPALRLPVSQVLSAPSSFLVYLLEHHLLIPQTSIALFFTTYIGNLPLAPRSIAEMTSLIASCTLENGAQKFAEAFAPAHGITRPTVHDAVGYEVLTFCKKPEMGKRVADQILEVGHAFEKDSQELHEVLVRLACGQAIPYSGFTGVGSSIRSNASLLGQAMDSFANEFNFVLGLMRDNDRDDSGFKLVSQSKGKGKRKRAVAKEDIGKAQEEEEGESEGEGDHNTGVPARIDLIARSSKSRHFDVEAATDSNISYSVVENDFFRAERYPVASLPVPHDTHDPANSCLEAWLTYLTQHRPHSLNTVPGSTILRTHPGQTLVDQVTASGWTGSDVVVVLDSKPIQTGDTEKQILLLDSISEGLFAKGPFSPGISKLRSINVDREPVNQSGDVYVIEAAFKKGLDEEARKCFEGRLAEMHKTSSTPVLAVTSARALVHYANFVKGVRRDEITKLGGGMFLFETPFARYAASTFHQPASKNYRPSYEKDQVQSRIIFLAGAFSVQAAKHGWDHLDSLSMLSLVATFNSQHAPDLHRICASMSSSYRGAVGTVISKLPTDTLSVTILPTCSRNPTVNFVVRLASGVLENGTFVFVPAQCGTDFALCGDFKFSLKEQDTGFGVLVGVWGDTSRIRLVKDTPQGVAYLSGIGAGVDIRLGNGNLWVLPVEASRSTQSGLRGLLKRNQLLEPVDALARSVQYLTSATASLSLLQHGLDARASELADSTRMEDSV